ncbi:MAG: FAD-dependent oxidoreductase [Bacilli bacterium]|nr:FAD-dependent oxidoreductase [Bacilli bacterium]
MYDLIIIGMGISGISAAIYAKNSNLNVLILEEKTPGGLLNRINEINNYPGLKKITGPELSYQLFESIEALKIPYKIDKVLKIILDNEIKIVKTEKEEYKTKNIIIATGRKNRTLNLEKEQELLGHGISTCALCDGNLYKEKTIAVVGGGNTALEETLYLSNLASKIYLIHRRDTFRAEQTLIEKIKQKANIEILYNSEVTKLIEEQNRLNKIEINHEKELSVSALFIFIGFVPNNDFLSSLDILNEEGYILVNNNYETKIKGIYAVGDCIKKEYYQLITASNDGVVASINIIKNNKN